MTDFYVADNPVGVKSRIPDIQSNDIILRVVGGMGGIRKTTIAKAIYNK
jgi:hypothetical protein